MEKLYSLNEVDNFISKYRNKKSLSSNVNSQKNKNVINYHKETNKKILNKAIIKEESKNNNEIITKDNKRIREYTISIFGNIYNSFSNNLSINNKENVFDSNILNNYLEELDLNYEESKERRNKIISNETKEKQENKNNLLNDIINMNKMKQIRNKKYYEFNHDYIIKYSDKDNNVILEHCYHLLFKDIDYFLYNKYNPVSYGNNDINLKKYQDLISILIDKNYIKEPIGYITLLLIEYILLNNIDMNKINLLTNIEIKNKIINYLLKTFKAKNIAQSPFPFAFFVNSKKILDILNTQNYNYINYNILSTKDNNNNNPINFILDLFNKDIFNKRNSISYFYFIVLNLDEKNIEENTKEIFANFDIYLFIIFNYLSKEEKKIKNICELLLNNSYSYNYMTYCQYIILKIILGNHEIINEKYYAKIFTTFLNFPSMEKLLIADCYNLILYSINSKVKNIFAKSSILIKYKYSLLKQKYKQDENDLILKQKIYENIAQFGKVHKNKFFMNYMQNEFCSNKKEDNNLTHKDSKENILNEDSKENELNGENNLNENCKDKENENNNNNNNNGFFSSIKFAFGFGSDISKHN